METRAEFAKLLNEQLRIVSEEENKRQELKSMIPQLANVLDTDRAQEEFFSINGVPDIVPFTGRFITKSQYPGYSTKIEAQEFGLMLQAERKLLDDKKYPVLMNRSTGLMRSAHRVQEKKMVRIFANATSTAFDFQISEEGKPLASSSHLTKVPGVSTSTGFNNVGTSAFNKTSLAAAKILSHKFKTGIGERYDTGDNYGIIYPDNLADKVEEVIGSEKNPDNANNTKNTYFNRYTKIPYMRLDDFTTTSWGLVDMDKMKEDLIWISRVKPESNSTVDYMTLATMQSIYARFACGFIDWRWIFWNQV